MAKKYIKTHTNYTLKRFHKNVSNGTILERDLATTTGNWSFPMGNGDRVPSYSQGNFKMTIRPGVNGRLRYRFGNWELNDGSCAKWYEYTGGMWNEVVEPETPTSNEVERYEDLPKDGGVGIYKVKNEIIWTELCLGEEKITTDSKIVLKPNYTSVRDFAYYGSATQLIQASIEGIIRKYPAELYFGDRIIQYIDGNGGLITLPGYEVENPFIIDLFTQSTANVEVENSLRYFCDSYDKYELLVLDEDGNIETTEPIKGHDVEIYDKWYRLELPEKGEDYTWVEIEPEYTQHNARGEDSSVLVPITYRHKTYYQFRNGRWIEIPKPEEELVVTEYENISERPVTADENTICLVYGAWSLPNGIIYRVGYWVCPLDGDRLATITINYGEEGSGNIIIEMYSLFGKWYFTTEDSSLKGKRIRPNSEEIERFFNNIDDFQQLLLNRRSNPLYKALLDTPYETDTGTLVYKESYIWPTLHGWNLDIGNSLQYNAYINSLSNLATFYDEYYTDNLWRMMIHESIKSMDLSKKYTDINDEPEEIIFGISKLEKMFKIYGRFFDDVKRYIDNIKFLNNVTYDSKNNLPDYFLTDTLNLDGWEMTNTMPSSDYDIITDGPLYEGESKGYSIVETHNEFLRRLKLNSKAIFSAKGTKKGVEMVMSLFGIPRGYYKLNEYVQVVTSGPDTTKVKEYNQKKLNYSYDSFESDEIINELQGLPIRQIDTFDENGEKIDEYIIPWFDKLQKIDGNPYFQMKGGWGKKQWKDISLEIAPEVKRIEDDGSTIYEETKKYIKMVNSLIELSELSEQNLINGDIYYVYDITDITMQYLNYGTEINVEEVSHYFILDNVDDNKIFGGRWKNIPIIDVEKGVNNGLKLLYVESIIDNNDGNNPHIGYGNYDDGSEYLDYFKTIFKYSIENNNFTNDITQEECEELKLLGFDIEQQRDNKKCWYFFDNKRYETVKELEEKFYDLTNALTTDFTNFPNGVNIEQAQTVIEQNIISYENGLVYNGPYKIKQEENVNGLMLMVEPLPVGAAYTTPPTRKTDYKPTNLEPGGEYVRDEPSAESIINVKTFEIINKWPTNLRSEFDKYFVSVVLPYIKQVIPSTTILIYDLNGEPYNTDGEPEDGDGTLNIFGYYVPEEAYECEEMNGEKTGYKIAQYALKQTTNGEPLDIDGNLISESGKQQAIWLLEGASNPGNYEVEKVYNPQTLSFFPGSKSPIKYYDPTLCPPTTGSTGEWDVTLNGTYVLSTTKTRISGVNNYITSNMGWTISKQPSNGFISPISGGSGNTMITVNSNGNFGDSDFEVKNSSGEIKTLGSIIATKLALTNGMHNTLLSLPNTGGTVSLPLIVLGSPNTFTVENNSGGWVVSTINGNSITLYMNENSGSDRETNIILKHGNSNSDEKITISVVQTASAMVTLSGRVVDDETGNPLSGARVDGKIGGIGLNTVFTNANGEYIVQHIMSKTEYDGLTDRTAIVNVELNGYETTTMQVDLPDYTTASTSTGIIVNVRMKEIEKPMAVTISGTVVDTYGAFLGGVSVNISVINSGTEQILSTRITDGQGKYTYVWSVTETEYNNWINIMSVGSKSGYNNTNKTVLLPTYNLAVANGVQIDLQMEEATNIVNIRGLVTSQTGEHLSGVTVNIPGIGTTTTNTNGEYSYDWGITITEYEEVTGITVNTQKTDYENGSTTRTPLPTYTNAVQNGIVINVTMTQIEQIETIVIRGRVYDQQTNTNIPGAEITIIQGIGATTTNNTGQYTYNWRITKSQYDMVRQITVAARKDGYEDGSTTNSALPNFENAVANGITINVGLIEVAQTILIFGKVIDSATKLPISGAVVNWAGETEITDINGEFSHNWVVTPSGYTLQSAIIFAANKEGYINGSNVYYLPPYEDALINGVGSVDILMNSMSNMNIEFVVDSGSGTFIIPFSQTANYGNTYSFDVYVNDVHYGIASGTTSSGAGYEVTGLTAPTATIRLSPRNSVSVIGWGRSFGFNNTATGSNATSNKNKLLRVLSDPDSAHILSTTDVGNDFRYCQFHGCTNLTTTIPEELPTTIINIGINFRSGQYQQCRSLTQPAPEVMPNTVTTIGNYFRTSQYDGCSSLTMAASEVLNDGVLTIGDDFRTYQYARCTNLTEHGGESFPNTITSFGDMFRGYQYYNCTKLVVAAQEKMSNAVTIIPASFRESQYMNCSSLRTIYPEVMPITASTIGERFRDTQFMACYALTQTAAEVLPMGVVTIGNSFRSAQYADCIALTQPATEVIPDTVQTIGDWFRGTQYSRCYELNAPATEVMSSALQSVGEHFRAIQYSACYKITRPATEILPNITNIGGYFRESQYYNCTAMLVGNHIHTYHFSTLFNQHPNNYNGMFGTRDLPITMSDTMPSYYTDSAQSNTAIVTNITPAIQKNYIGNRTGISGYADLDPNWKGYLIQ